MTGSALSPALAARARAIAAGPKLVALMALASVLLLTRSPWLLGAAAALGGLAGLLVVGRDRLAALGSGGLVVAVAAVALFTWAVEGAEPALAVLFRLAGLILFAQLVTETTRASAVQDALVAALRPFERLPFVSAEKAGLALAIVLRSLPRLGAAVGELREAREARGLRVTPVRLVVPLIARILRDARETADAIDARSWGGGIKDMDDDHA